MKILFLGTGSVCGVPEWNCDCTTCTSTDPKDKRMRSAILVQIDDTNIAVDFGPDFRTQLLNNSIKKLDYALLTHSHGDHMNGYQEFARQKNINIYSSQEVLDDFYKRAGDAKWLAERNPTAKIEPFRPFQIDNVEVDIIALEHKKDYSKTGTPCNGYLFRSPFFTFAYTSDYNAILEEEKVRGIDLLISDGSGMDPKEGHVGINGSIEVYNQLQPRKMVITHINHTTSHQSLTEYVQSKGNIEIAYDGKVIEIPAE